MILQIETPALLFGATSLILLAYTNRFLTIATIVRGLKKTYKEKQNDMILLEIKNLNLRLTLIRNNLSFWTEFTGTIDFIGIVILGNQYFSKCVAIAFERFSRQRSEIKLTFN